jgi:hypothetical protein
MSRFTIKRSQCLFVRIFQILFNILHFIYILVSFRKIRPCGKVKNISIMEIFLIFSVLTRQQGSSGPMVLLIVVVLNTTMVLRFLLDPPHFLAKAACCSVSASLQGALGGKGQAFFHGVVCFQHSSHE